MQYVIAIVHVYCLLGDLTFALAAEVVRLPHAILGVQHHLYVRKSIKHTILFVGVATQCYSVKICAYLATSRIVSVLLVHSSVNNAGLG